VTFNVESLVLPDSQVHPFYTPSSRPIFGDVLRCSAMFCDGRRCYGGVKAVFGDVMAMFGDVMAMFGDVRRDYGGTWMLWRCSAMFGEIMAGPG